MGPGLPGPFFYGPTTPTGLRVEPGFCGSRFRAPRQRESKKRTDKQRRRARLRFFGKVIGMNEIMKTTAAVFHIAPGMTPEVIEFAKEIQGKRLGEHEASRRGLGITHERAWIEVTNAGDLLIFYFEGGDLDRSMMIIGESDNLHDIWFREKIFALTGYDLCDYRQIKPAELLYESPEAGTKPADSVATVFPVLTGKLDDFRQWLHTATVTRVAEYREYQQRFGLTGERFFLKHSPEGDMIIMYAEGNEPASSIARFARSSHPYDVWMREELLNLSGIDFIRRQTAPPPYLALEWKMPAGVKAA